MTGSHFAEPELKLVELGRLKVYIEGDLANRKGKTCFVTVHDIGTNHKSWRPLLSSPLMDNVLQKSIFLHICIPGQEDFAEDLPDDYAFPTLDQLAEEIAAVIDHFKIRAVVAMGEGAGANIVARFALQFPNIVYGVLLFHCTSTTAGIVEYVGDKYINYKLTTTGMNHTAYMYLVHHKFGEHVNEDSPLAQSFIDDLKTYLNANNLSRYLTAFLERTDLTMELSEKFAVDALLLTGAKASHLHTVYNMHQHMSRRAAALMVVDDVGDVLTESPQKVARALILFCKGLGVLTTVPVPGMDRQRSLSNSMEEADKAKSTVTAR